MAITYHSGRRIQATQADFDGIPAVSGGWKEVGRTTLGSAGDTISVSSLADKRYLMILTNQYGTGGDTVSQLGLGNSSIDATANYARRASNNGGAESVVTGRSYIFESMDVTQAGMFGVDYIANKSDKEKLGIRHLVYQNTAGAGNAPNRERNYGKWLNSSNVIDIIRDKNTAAGSFDTGSEIVVLGYDPDDTHTDNFWEELANVDLSGGSADLLSSGTINAKKYLWLQAYIEPTGTVDIDVTFNNDTSGTNGVDGNYARRNNYNGGTDSTNINQNNLQWSNNVTVPQFMNCFIINNSAKEKLIIMEQVRQGTPPNRYHISGKWSNTSSQITEIDITNGESGSYDTKSFIKVWGAN